MSTTNETCVITEQENTKESTSFSLSRVVTVVASGLGLPNIRENIVNLLF
ncbi:hypothetical protein HanXRQr2_Chr02g0069091 [Helianthus annuus]|uniref:Uncharacterized protein n=1 Tax=Helianthus annuus TaxID=4232 RepID=A0A9K3JQE0_HELAN|nr:hypothetical protein HanXRQr2_Chr02g0069091 [Helianthus annuus]KAJ0952018.1 hypothetical protein HanPSC8_Chr02g0067251 [Helianthus annuus]